MLIVQFTIATFRLHQHFISKLTQRERKKFIYEINIATESNKNIENDMSHLAGHDCLFLGRT